MLLVAGGVAASLLLLSHELGSLHGTLSKNRAAGSLFSGPATTSPGHTTLGGHGSRRRSPDDQQANGARPHLRRAPTARHHHSGGVLSGLGPVLVAGH